LRFPFFLENRAVCEIMWKNVVESGRSQLTIWSMRIACWIITKATSYQHTLGICNTFCSSTATVVTRTRVDNVYSFVASSVCSVFLPHGSYVPVCTSAYLLICHSAWTFISFLSVCLYTLIFLSR
jgi:hypothetical protein